MHTAATFGRDGLAQSLPEQFEKVVEMNADRLAVKMGKHALTYEDLNRTANRIAHAILDQRGLGSEPIALLFEHGVDIIAAIFGVLKAGKFFVALDTSFPRERIRFIIKDSGARLLLTADQNLAQMAIAGDTQCGLLNTNEIHGAVPGINPGVPISLDDPANLRYTSGSTGEPKGVIRSHGSSARVPTLTPVSSEDRFSLLHSLSFGSAAGDLYLSLLNGASLFPFNVKSEGVQRLASWLRQERITICHLPPPLFRQLAELISDQEMLPDLRLIRLSGEPITRLDFELYKRHFSSRTLLGISMGATEAGRIGTAVLSKDFEYPDGGTPVGYPAPGKKILLLDGRGHEVGPLQIGEIAIKGAGLASGYWSKHQLSSAKFITDPNGKDEQIYMTGDLGQMRPDGFLIHMGRKDFMVKIRGYRVELGEIQGTLLAHPLIKDVGVVAWDRNGEEKYLAAYVVPRQIPPTINELNSFLKAKLSDYMMPSTFTFLDSLPVINGKLDRAALPKPDHGRPNLDHAYLAPGNAAEQKLTQIWQEVLDVRPIGIRDDFFDLGGHSLLASRLFVQIDKAFAKQLPMATLYHARTIEQLAVILQQDGWTSPWSLLVPIQSKGPRPPFFWVSGESTDTLLPRYLGQDQPIYALMHPCHDGKRVRYNTLQDLASHHLQEIRTVQPHGPYYLGGSCIGGMVAFEMAQQLLQQGQMVALLALLDLATIKNCQFLVNQVPVFHESFNDEVNRHLRVLWALSSREKLQYIGVRLTDRINELVSGMRNVAEQLIRGGCRIYLLTGRPVPFALRLRYISIVDRKFLAAYQPQPYPGRLIHFKAAKGSLDTELVQRLSNGEFVNHEVPGAHLEVAKEPHVQVWATMLKGYLEQAQADELDNPNNSRATFAKKANREHSTAILPVS